MLCGPEAHGRHVATTCITIVINTSSGSNEPPHGSCVLPPPLLQRLVELLLPHRRLPKPAAAATARLLDLVLLGREERLLLGREALLLAQRLAQARGVVELAQLDVHVRHGQEQGRRARHL